jgi:hypothetical protein
LLYAPYTITDLPASSFLVETRIEVGFFAGHHRHGNAEWRRFLEETAGAIDPW